MKGDGWSYKLEMDDETGRRLHRLGEITKTPMADVVAAALQRYEDALLAQVERSGRGEFCAPRDEDKPTWLLYFGDRDKGISVYHDEVEAHARFREAEGNWTCMLFELCRRPKETT